MSKKKTNTPELPEIPDLTKEQLNRLLCADYLEFCAQMVRRGAMTGFDFIWHEKMEKPQGKLVVTSQELTAPLETYMLNELDRQKPSPPPTQIQVQDSTEEVAEHQKGGKCKNPGCIACNNPNKA